MKWDEFQAMLKEAGITQTEFSRAVQLQEWTVSMWRKRKNQVPTWVRSWLILYKAALGDVPGLDPLQIKTKPTRQSAVPDKPAPPAAPAPASQEPQPEANRTEPAPISQTAAPIAEETAAPLPAAEQPQSFPEPAPDAPTTTTPDSKGSQHGRLEFLEERTIAPLSD